MVPLTGQNTVNDMVDRINEVSQEIQDVAFVNANAVMGPASSSADQIMAFSDTTGKSAKAANISPFAYSILDDADDAAARETLGLKSAAVLDAATAATPNTAVQRDASGNITGVGITASSGFVGNGSQITSLDMNNAASGTLAVANGGTGTTTSTGTGSVVRSASPTFTGTPLSTTASADTNTTQIATTAYVIGQVSSTAPLMDGVAAVGTSLRYARADHVHPSDTTKVNTSLLGVANGVATLDSAGKVPTSQLPAYVDDVLEYANLASFPATGETGKIYVSLDTNKTYRWSGSAYIYITSGAVDSVAGKTGVVTLVKGDVGLGNVDNTSDVNKPVSTAQQNALNLKANIASPALTGVPTAPTAAVGTNTTQLATTEFVQAEIANDTPTKTGTGASGSWGISVTGNAATATKLATARTIGGVSFDGTANINLPGVNAAGNQNTAGNAATATNLKAIAAGTIGAGTAANWYEVCNWVLGGQYNNFAARFVLSGRGNSPHHDELHVRGEFGPSAFAHTAFELYSFEGVADNLTWVMTFDNATKTARLYLRRAGTDWGQTMLTPLAHYTEGAGFTITGTLFGTTAPTGDTVITRDPTNAKRIYHDGYKPSADKLTTARTINGVAFDGTANITVADSTKLPLTGGTLSGDLNVGATTRTANSVVRVLSDDAYVAGFEAYGATQGTGYLFVGQDGGFGGGIVYNGDGNPAFATGESFDTVCFYRMASGVREAVFSYPNNSNNVTFRGVIYGNGSGLTSLALANVTGLQTALDSKVSLTGDQSVAGVKTFSTALEVTGTSKAAGRFYAGTTDPSNTTRTNYDGKLHATGFGSGRFVMEYNAATESLDFNFV